MGRGARPVAAWPVARTPAHEFYFFVSLTTLSTKTRLSVRLTSQDAVSQRAPGPGGTRGEGQKVKIENVILENLVYTR